MLSATEMYRAERGSEWKRYVRAAAALHELYDDTAIGRAVGRTRIAVGQWWRGVRPEPDALQRLAAATGLSLDELSQFVYYDGPPPRLEPLAGVAEAGVVEGIRRDQGSQQSADSEEPAPSPVPPPRDRRGALS